MLEAVDHVNKAVQTLVCRNAMLNQRLHEAAKEFSAALGQVEQWPSSLQAEVAHISQRLTAKGTIDATISGMDVSTARSIAEDMLGLALAISTSSMSPYHRRHVMLPTERGRRRRLDVHSAKK